MKTDLFTLGETMIRLTPPGDLRLEQTAALNLTIGGAESTVAANLARLGKTAAWFSRLPDNPRKKPAIPYPGTWACFALWPFSHSPGSC